MCTCVDIAQSETTLDRLIRFLAIWQQNGLFLATDLEEWMADSRVSLYSDGQGEVDGTWNVQIITRDRI